MVGGRMRHQYLGPSSDLFIYPCIFCVLLLLLLLLFTQGRFPYNNNLALMIIHEEHHTSRGLFLLHDRSLGYFYFFYLNVLMNIVLFIHLELQVMWNTWETSSHLRYVDSPVLFIRQSLFSFCKMYLFRRFFH